VSEHIAKPEAERVVLGSILLNNQLFYDCTGLQPHYFGLEAHRRIFARTQELDAAGKPIDETILGAALVEHHELETVGGESYLYDLTCGVCARPSIKEHVEIIRDAAKRRALQNSCTAIAERLSDWSNKTADCITEQEDLLLKLRALDGLHKVSKIKDVVVDVLNEMARQRKHKNELLGYSTGLPEIDAITTGIRDGEYWVVGGAPSRGKTILGTQITAVNASAGVPTLVFSIEMSKQQFVKRMIPRYCKMPAWKVRDFREASTEDYDRVQATGDVIAQWPVYIVDPEGMTASEISAIARLYIRRHKVKLIVVDYLQIINGPEREIRHRVANASNVLRGVAKSEGVAMVVLSQLRRPENESDLPNEFMLRESGDIEAHAQTLLLIHRPKDDQRRWTGEDLVIVAKQREGLVGANPVLMDPDQLWFVPRDGR
jgi:replicative DNA helicase